MTRTPKPKTESVPRLDLTSYRGQWVALDPKTYEVLGYGKSVRDAEQAAAEKSTSRPLLLPVPESDAYFVGGGGSTADS